MKLSLLLFLLPFVAADHLRYHRSLEKKCPITVNSDTNLPQCPDGCELKVFNSNKKNEATSMCVPINCGKPDENEDCPEGCKPNEEGINCVPDNEPVKKGQEKGGE